MGPEGRSGHSLQSLEVQPGLLGQLFLRTLHPHYPHVPRNPCVTLPGRSPRPGMLVRCLKEPVRCCLLLGWGSHYLIAGDHCLALGAQLGPPRSVLGCLCPLRSWAQWPGHISRGPYLLPGSVCGSGGCQGSGLGEARVPGWCTGALPAGDPACVCVSVCAPTLLALPPVSHSQALSHRHLPIWGAVSQEVGLSRSLQHPTSTCLGVHIGTSPGLEPPQDPGKLGRLAVLLFLPWRRGGHAESQVGCCT